MKNILRNFKFNFQELFLFLYLVSFPFAQLLRLQMPLNGGYLAIYPTDIFVLLFVVSALIKGSISKLIKDNKHFYPFLIITTFSIIVSFFVSQFNFLPGLMYLIRLLTYLLFWVTLLKFKSQLVNINTVLVICFSIGVFGVFQYLAFPDLRALFYLGWDDHLYRLSATFLDPGFTSIFLVFGFLVSLILYLKNNKKYFLFLGLFFLLTLGFTYARAGFVAVIISSLYILIKHKKYLWILLGVIGISIGVFLLPQKPGEATNLRRMFSINLRIENYKTTFKIFKQSPLFGIGYNNICEYKIGKLDYKDVDSHSCSGSDNGILLILATTGVVGLISFIDFVIRIVKRTKNNYLGEIFVSCGVALLIHAQFVNSIFYPWVLGIMGVMYSLSRNEKHNKE